MLDIAKTVKVEYIVSYYRYDPSLYHLLKVPFYFYKYDELEKAQAYYDFLNSEDYYNVTLDKVVHVCLAKGNNWFDPDSV